MREKVFAPGVIHRVSAYIRYLTQLSERGQTSVTSCEIGSATGINSAEVRRDLLSFGIDGKRGVGYDVKYLLNKLESIFCPKETVNIVLVGAGNLGAAILKYDPLRKQGFNIVGIFDNDPRKVGKSMGDVVVMDMSKLKEVVEKTGASVAIIAVPPSSAQAVADEVVESGIKVILNYTPVRIKVGPDVIVKSSDPVEKLLHTLFYLRQTQASILVRSGSQ